jgi:hypothetical protein
MRQSTKRMITVVWNLSGFHVMAALQNIDKFNAGSSTREIFQGIKDWRE